MTKIITTLRAYFFSNHKNSAIVELTFAGALWGFGFIATIWTLHEMGPLTVTGFRFVLAAAVGYTSLFLIRHLRAPKGEATKYLSLAQFKLAMVPGLILSLTLLLQT